MQSDTPDDIAPREAPDAQRRFLQYASQLADAMLQWVKTHLDAQALSQAANCLRSVWGDWDRVGDRSFCAKTRAHCASIWAWAAKRNASNGTFEPWLVLAESWCLQSPLPKTLVNDRHYKTFRALARREQGMMQSWADVLSDQNEGAASGEIAHFMRFCRAQAWIESGQAGRAIECLESDFAQGVDHPILWLLLADAATEQGELGKADYAIGMARPAPPHVAIYAIGNEERVDMLAAAWERIVEAWASKLGRAALETLKSRRSALGDSCDLGDIDEALIALALDHGDVLTRCEAVELAFARYVASDSRHRSTESIALAAQTIANDADTLWLFLERCAAKAENIVLRSIQRIEDYSGMNGGSEYNLPNHSTAEFNADSAWIESLYDLFVCYEKCAVAPTAEGDVFRALTQIDAPAVAIETAMRCVDRIDAGSPLYWAVAGLCVALGLASNEIESTVLGLSRAFATDSPRATLLLFKLLSGLGRDAYRYVAELLAQSIGARETGALFARIQHAGDPYQTLSRQIAELAAREAPRSPVVDRAQLGRYMLPIELQAVYDARRAMTPSAEEVAKRARRHDVLMARGVIEKDTMREAPGPAQWRHERSARASDAFDL